MNMTKEASQVIQDALAYASENDYEYITPEMILLMMCESVAFQEAFEGCEGDVEELATDLVQYMEEYIAHVEGAEPDFSAGSSYVFAYAGRCEQWERCD